MIRYAVCHSRPALKSAALKNHVYFHQDFVPGRGAGQGFLHGQRREDCDCTAGGNKP